MNLEATNFMYTQSIKYKTKYGLIAAANESNESTEIFAVWSCSFARNNVVNAESITDT